MEYEILLDKRTIKVEITDDRILVDGQEIQAEIGEQDGLYTVHQSSTISSLRVLRQEGNHLTLLVNGKPQELVVNDHISMLLEKLGMTDEFDDKTTEIKAPMPGAILDVMVAEGDEVEEGQALLILEAMKMENLLKSPNTGKIKKINVHKGTNVEKNATLIEFE